MTQSVKFSVVLASPKTSIVYVDYTTVDGTGIAGTDYEGLCGQLVFCPGETTKEIDVDIYPDLISTSEKQFGFSLSNPSGADISEFSYNSVGIIPVTGITDLPHVYTKELLQPFNPDNPYSIYKAGLPIISIEDGIIVTVQP